MTDIICHVIYETPPVDDAERRVLADLDEVRASLRLHLREPRRWTESLRRLSFARAIQGSNSIEGYDAALDDVAAVAAGEEPLDADEETTLALRGYRDAMTYVLQLARDPDFAYTTQLLKSLHFMMTGYDLRNRPGQWRAGAIYVHDEATGDVTYEGPELDLVPGLMTELVTRLDAVEQDLVAAAMAHLNLVMIHPFRDGNGRMARCLQSLVLARARLLSPVFMSIEEYLGRNTRAYYDVLGEVGKGRWSPAGDARPWLRFALTAHLRQARTMVRRVRESERLWTELEILRTRHRLPERVLSALFDASVGFRVRNSTYRAAVATEEDITEQTASRDLRELVRTGLLVDHGKARGRYYTAGPAIVRVRQRISSGWPASDDTDPFQD